MDLFDLAEGQCVQPVRFGQVSAFILLDELVASVGFASDCCARKLKTYLLKPTRFVSRA